MRPRFRVSPVFPILFLLAPVAAPAFPSSSGGSGLFDVQSASVPVAGSMTAGFTGVDYRVLDEHEIGPFGDRDVVDWGLLFSFGFRGWIEAYGRWNETFLSVDRASAMSHRDGLVGAKVAIPSAVPWMETAIAGSLNLPWGVRKRGFSTGFVDPAISGLLTLHVPESNVLTSASLHLNVGYHFHGDSRGRAFEGFPPYYLEPVYPEGDNDRLDLRLAAELGSERLTLFAELLLDALLTDGVSYRESPLFLTPGFRYSINESFSFLLSSKISLATDDEASGDYRSPDEIYPDWQLGFAFSWSRFGPDVDRDGDGVPDVRDRCPRAAEDPDGWEDHDGCPDSDNDGDGVRDEFDEAPDRAEDFDGYLDSDGIPEPDNDGDGFFDVEDECPNEAEDMDGVADGDGCPEFDADGDGVVDPYDACPELAAPEGGLNGCPEGLGFDSPFQLKGLEWREGEVAPEPMSFVALNDLASKLKKLPRIGIEIRVHPPTFGDAVSNARLAEQRAEYLKGFLVESGVETTRIVARAESRVPAIEPAPTRVFIVPFEVGAVR